MDNRFLNIPRLPVSHMHTVLVQNPSVGIMWLVSPLCSFTFQLVKHFVGGPDVLTCLRIWSLRLPCVLWPNMPNTAVHMRLVASGNKMTESRLPPHLTPSLPPHLPLLLHMKQGCLGLHLLRCPLARTHPQFRHVYRSACSTNHCKMIWK